MVAGQSYQKRVLRVLLHIQRNLDQSLEQAAQKLRFSDSPVIDAALDAGYESHEAFTRAFSARFGMPPFSYRKERRRSCGAVAWKPRTLARFSPRRKQTQRTPPTIRVLLFVLCGFFASSRDSL